MDDELKQKIEDIVTSDRIVLVMKGNPAFPSCGFSANAVNILREYVDDFGSFDVLRDEEVRQGIKEYADWPTFPQLWVEGKLVGGHDIIVELHERGDLGELISEDAEGRSSPAQ